MKSITHLTPNIWVGYNTEEPNKKFFGSSEKFIEAQLDERLRQIAERTQTNVPELYGETRPTHTQQGCPLLQHGLCRYVGTPSSI